MKAQQLIPLQDWCLVRRLHRDTTEAGLKIPLKAQENQPDARILAVGPGYFEDGKLIEPRVKVGDKVVIDPSMLPAVAGIELDGEVFFLVRERFIIAIVREERDN
jgi:chaperonin GroES